MVCLRLLTLLVVAKAMRRQTLVTLASQTSPTSYSTSGLRHLPLVATSRSAQHVGAAALQTTAPVNRPQAAKDIADMHALRRKQAAKVSAQRFDKSRYGQARLGHKTLLEHSSVGIATRNDYIRRLHEFQAFLGQGLHNLHSAKVLEQHLLDFFDTLWWGGAAVGHGNEILAPVQWHLPQFDRRN